MNAPPKPLPLGLTLRLVLALLLSSALVARPVLAADLLVVTSIADDGDGSLRQAIADISPGGRITFSHSLSGQTIILTSPLVINKNLLIDCSDLGVPITISGNYAVQVFQIGLLGEVTLSSLKITNGYGWLGGGINNQGELWLIDSIVSKNLAGFKGGGIFTNGTLLVERSTFSYNEADLGGGIRSDEGIYSQMTVTDSTFYGNQAVHGGAIDVWGAGPNKISTSSFYGNMAAASGGAIRIWSSLTVENSTFSGNITQCGGGFNIQDEGMLTLQHVTLNHNMAASGGGIYVGNNATLKYINTIIAHSTNGDCVDHGTIHADSTHNLVTDGNCSALLDDDPMLGPLANNGGPTLTHALLPGSPAIDAGSIAYCPITDQRGVSRPQGTACDIGAYEMVEILVVTSIADGGDGSLRAAIADISPGGTITFDTDLSGQTITLSSTLVIEKNLTIDGSDLAVPITISGNNAAGVFVISSLGKATFDSLMIINGNDEYGGGGIYNLGQLSVVNSTISGNTSGFGNGGGIFNLGDLTIMNSTLSGNMAYGRGGGIFNLGDLTIMNSTLSGNMAAGGGGVYNDGRMTVRNSTFSGNVAEQEGGGVYNDNNGILNFTNTIIAYSTKWDCANYGTIHTDSTHNLVTDGSCGALLDDDPKLGPLADNGGPTLTHALLSGSPAIDAGHNGYCTTTDQRGVSRPQGTACDIGAYEMVEILVVTSIADGGDGSLRAAIADISPGVKISFSPSLSGKTIILTSPLVINKNLTIDGSDLAVPIAISGKNDVGVFMIGPLGKATFDSLMIINGNDEYGGGIYNWGNLTIINCTIANNYGKEGGGGIFNSDNAYLWIVDSTLSNNTTEGDGGGIFNMGFLEVVNSILSENIAGSIMNGGKGGAILNHELSQQLTVVNSTLSGNEAGANGGGIHNEGTLMVENSAISENRGLTGTGGGLHNEGTLTLLFVVLNGNEAGFGGGIYTNNTLIMTDSTLSGNSAYYGGGIYNPLGDSLINNSALFGNTATLDGGGILNEGTLYITNSTLSGNLAGLDGGGILNVGTLYITNSTLSGNLAGLNGGGILNDDMLTLLNVTLNGNSAVRHGGGIINFSGNTLNFINTIIAHSTNGGDCLNNGTIHADSTHNLVTDGSCGALLDDDPMLGPLANNGGPTLTHALLPGSPAIDAGSIAYCPIT
ncbi:MAG: hypothetical protein K0B06_10230, partial [Brevefilum sp.]|nr:hypothetical protein [Brevefilum sp.]